MGDRPSAAHYYRANLDRLDAEGAAAGADTVDALLFLAEYSKVSLFISYKSYIYACVHMHVPAHMDIYIYIITLVSVYYAIHPAFRNFSDIKLHDLEYKQHIYRHIYINIYILYAYMYVCSSRLTKIPTST